jgi:hypothetical protein
MLRLVPLAPHTILCNQHHALLGPDRVENITGGLGAINLQTSRLVPSCTFIQPNITRNVLFLSHHVPRRSRAASCAASATTTILGFSHQFNHFSRLVFEVYGEFIAVLRPKWAECLSIQTNNRLGKPKVWRPSFSPT